MIENTWDDAARQLTLAARVVGYPSQPSARQIHLVLIRPQQGIGEGVCVQPEKVARYEGRDLVMIATGVP